MVPRSVFEQQAVPLLATGGVDVDPFRAWTVALERRGCGRPDQLSTLSAQGPDSGAPLRGVSQSDCSAVGVGCWSTAALASRCPCVQCSRKLSLGSIPLPCGAG
eukprot:13810560-Alexandrium_andersonii.AAC.1